MVIKVKHYYIMVFCENFMGTETFTWYYKCLSGGSYCNWKMNKERNGVWSVNNLPPRWKTHKTLKFLKWNWCDKNRQWIPQFTELSKWRSFKKAILSKLIRLLFFKKTQYSALENGPLCIDIEPIGFDNVFFKVKSFSIRHAIFCKNSSVLGLSNIINFIERYCMYTKPNSQRKWKRGWIW